MEQTTEEFRHACGHGMEVAKNVPHLRLPAPAKRTGYAVLTYEIPDATHDISDQDVRPGKTCIRWRVTCVYHILFAICLRSYACRRQFGPMVIVHYFVDAGCAQDAVENIPGGWERAVPDSCANLFSATGDGSHFATLYSDFEIFVGTSTRSGKMPLCRSLGTTCQRSVSTC